MMNRVEAENYIYESYNRVAKLLDYDAPDSRKRHPELTEAVLGSFPHVPAVAVTGSKGKGSVCTMISAIMSERVRTGLFTSPHVLRFNERFAVDGREITDGEFTDCVSRVKELFERDRSETDPGRKGGAAGGEAGERSRAEGGREISDREETPSLSYISPIGIEAAVALTFFLDKKTGFNVLECGKGARYDDVNNIAHEYAVITPIFLEHTRELGKTLREIAEDKACIIKEGMRCAFAAAQPDEVMEVLRARAEKCGVPLKVYGTDFRAENVTCSKRGILFDLTVGDRKFESIFLPLIGSFQAENAALALAVCLDAVCFLRDGSMARHEEGAAGKEEKTSVLKGEEIGHALAGVSRPGRMEIIAEEPLTILDATINRKSAVQIKEALEGLGIKRVISVIAVPDDKDFEGVALELKDISCKMILTRAKNPHYVFTDRQYRVLEGSIKDLSLITDPGEAMEAATRAAMDEKTAVLLAGTTSFVGEIKKRQHP